ncbi:hypothetical protein AB0J80_19295 [Actinoplanes sp. NPDC049548]|uniref:hypothetical protein n=1 Tax=Actinoplanes sp. NPDC049548 TaxID=3155152 RepID=UPI00343BC5AA
MGVDYSYQVYVPHRAVGRFLRNVAALSRNDGTGTTVLLPDGTEVLLPGTYGFEAGRTVEWADVIAASSFDLSPCFPADAPLREFDAMYGGTAHPWPDGTVRYSVAYTYLMVFDGSELLPEHSIFDFTPATTGQSQLFLRSPSIRRTFADLAMSVGAPLCLLDVEEDFHVVVTARDRALSIRVPGPCVLWDRGARAAEAYRELSAEPTPEGRWIIGPDHPGYAAFAASVARHSGVAGTVTPPR